MQNYFLAYLPGLILFGLGMSLVIAPLTKSALQLKEILRRSIRGEHAVSRVAGMLAVVFWVLLSYLCLKDNLIKNLQPLA